MLSLKSTGLAVPASYDFEGLTPMTDSPKRRRNPMATIMFGSRWLQLPLYLGLIVAQAVYVFQFWTELVHLVEAAFGNQEALKLLVDSVGYKAGAPVWAWPSSTRPSSCWPCWR